MRRAVRVLLLLAALLHPACGHAEMAADAGASFDTAYAAFQVRATQRRQEGTMPRLAVPADRALIEALWDVKRLGTPPYGAADFAPAVDIWAKQLAVMKAYATFSGSAAAGPPLADNNETFQPEELAAMNAILKMEVVVLAAADALLHRLTPAGIAARRAGLLQLRAATTTHVRSAAGLIGNDIGRADKATLAATLDAGGPTFAAAVTPQDRQALATVALSAAIPPDPATRPALDRFIAALSIATCEGLCAVK